MRPYGSSKLAPEVPRPEAKPGEQALSIAQADERLGTELARNQPQARTGTAAENRGIRIISEMG